MTTDTTTGARAAPGPETDRLVAERFMGWHLEPPPERVTRGAPPGSHWHDRRGVFTGWATENCCWAVAGRGMCDVFSPSTEPRHVSEVVVAEASRRGLVCRVAPAAAERREVGCDLISADGEPLASGRGETTAIAVCRAVLGLPEEGGSRC